MDCGADSSFLLKCLFTYSPDCGEPPSQAGYSATKDGGTTYDETATVTCDTGNGYTGTPPKISCGSDGSWTAYSGCSLAGIILVASLYRLFVFVSAWSMIN